MTLWADWVAGFTYSTCNTTVKLIIRIIKNNKTTENIENLESKKILNFQDSNTKKVLIKLKKQNIE